MQLCGYAVKCGSELCGESANAVMRLYYAVMRLYNPILDEASNLQRVRAGLELPRRGEQAYELLMNTPEFDLWS